MAQVRCPNCLTMNGANNRFCRSCGNQLIGATPPTGGGTPPAGGTSPTPEPKRKTSLARYKGMARTATIDDLENNHDEVVDDDYDEEFNEEITKDHVIKAQRIGDVIHLTVSKGKEPAPPEPEPAPTPDPAEQPEEAPAAQAKGFRSTLSKWWNNELPGTENLKRKG